MSEAKRYEGPIVPGMKFWTSAGSKARGDELRTVVALDHSHSHPVQWDRGGGDTIELFRAWRVPAEPPAAPVERALAPGWAWSRPSVLNRCSVCGGRLGGTEALSSPGCQFHCPPCGEIAGAFVPPPTKERPLATGWRDGWDQGCHPCWLAKKPDWRTVGRLSRGPDGARVGHCPPCAEAAGAFSDAAPAPRPTSDPKAAPRYLDDLDRNPRLLEEMRAKTAPVAKPPRRWVHQVEENAKTAGPCPYAEWAALQTGIATGLVDNRPRATVGTVPQVYGLSVGILSRGMAR